MPQTTKYTDFLDGPPAKPQKSATLDADRYSSKEFMAHEWETVWKKSWLLAGVVQDVAEPGDYFVFEIGPESIIITRTDDGDVAAVYNACQHRGNKIFTNHSGNVQAISCPYHGWTYELDGTLKKVPDEERFAQGLPCEELSLKTVKVEVRVGLVWVNMDPEAAPVEDFLGVVLDQYELFHFENMVMVLDQTVELDANWKTAVDNFNEQYHVDFIHPQHASRVNCRDSVNELWPYGHRRTCVESFVTNPRYGAPEEPPPILDAMMRGIGLDPAEFKGRVSEVRRAAQNQKRKLGEELGFSYAELSDELVSDVWQYDLFPNVIMTIHPEELWIMRPRPHPTDPNKCFFDKITLQIPAEIAFDRERGIGLLPDVVLQDDLGGTRPEHDVFDREAVISGKKSMVNTIDQDIHYLPDMQRGMRSQGFERAWLNADESRVQHFHDWLDAWIEGNPMAKLRSVA